MLHSWSPTPSTVLFPSPLGSLYLSHTHTHTNQITGWRNLLLTFLLNLSMVRSHKDGRKPHLVQTVFRAEIECGTRISDRVWMNECWGVALRRAGGRHLRIILPTVAMHKAARTLKRRLSMPSKILITGYDGSLHLSKLPINSLDDRSQTQS